MARVQLEGVLKLVDVKINTQILNKISRATAGMPQSLQQTATAAQAVNTGMKQAGRAVQGTKAQMTSLDRVARQFVQRMAQFAILLPTFATLNRAIQGSVKFIAQFETQLANILRIDIEGLRDRMDDVAGAAFDIGIKFGSSADKAVETIRIFKQAGQTIEASFALAGSALLATQVTTLQAVEAQEVLLAITKQFNIEAERSTNIIDKLAKAEDIAALGASDVADAFRTGGNALAFFTKDVDFAIGLVAALREQTRKSGREVGTFFKTLAARISAQGEPQKAVENLIGPIKDLNGVVLSGEEVLTRLKIAFDNLTESEKANQAKAISGVRQFESFIAVMKSFNRAVEISEDVTNSQGTALEKLGIVQRTINFQAQQAVAEFQKLAVAMGEAGLQDAIVNVIKAGRTLAGIFTDIAGALDTLNISIAPLLTLGALRIGKRVFGLGAAAGAGAGAMMGGGGAQGMATFNAQMAQSTKNFVALNAQTTAAARAQSGLTTAQTTATATTKVSAQALSMQTRLFVASHGALQNFIARLRAAGQAAVSRRGLGMGAAIAGAIAIGTAVEALEKVLQKELSIRQRSLAQLGKGAGQAAQTGLLIGLFNAKLGLIVGALQFGVERITSLFEAMRISKEAKKEEAAIQKVLDARQAIITAAIAGEIDSAPIFDAITQRLEQSGGALSGAVIDALKQDLSGLDLFKDDRFKGIKGRLQDFLFDPQFLSALAIADDRFIGLGIAIKDAAQPAKATGELLKALGVSTNAFGGAALNTVNALDLAIASKDGLKFAFKLIETENAIAENRNRLAIAQARSNNLFKTEVAVREQELKLLKELPNVAEQQLQRLTRTLQIRPDIFGFIGKDGETAAERAEQFSKRILTAFEQLERGEAVNLVEEFGGVVLDGQRDLYKELTDIFTNGEQARLKVVNAAQRLEEAQVRQRAAAIVAATAASEEMTEVTNRYRQSLIDLGLDTKDASAALNELQQLDVTAFDDVIRGVSALPPALQRVVQALAGEPIDQARAKLEITQQRVAETIDQAATKLEKAKEALAKLDKTADKSADTLTARADLEKKTAQLAAELREAQLSGVVEVGKASLEVLQAESDEKKKAAEATAKLAKATERYRQRLAEVELTARDTADAFREFIANEIAELTEKEAEARGELADAQKAVLDSTDELADAFEELGQAIFEFNDSFASAQVTANLLQRDIAMLTGGLSTFRGRLDALSRSFDAVLSNANISLEKRIELERQLAEETISFLQEARQEIVTAGLQIFGQDAMENRALQEGIAGLSIVAEKLGGSFDNFLNLGEDQFRAISQELLSLPVDLRQKILDALSTLPSTLAIGGFSVEELRTALGQVGAGISPEMGLPSVEELLDQEVQQLERLQDLALRSTEIQLAQAISASEAVELAEAQLDAAQIAEERARQQLKDMRADVNRQISTLEAAQAQREILASAIINSQNAQMDKNVQDRIRNFSEQNLILRDLQTTFVQGLSKIAGAVAQARAAGAAIPTEYGGHVPNFAGGNLSPREIAGLIRAASKEKRMMPQGAGLAVANTSEAIIPMRAKGHVPNFQQGNGSPIAAGIAATRNLDVAVIAAISRSIVNALGDAGRGDPELTRLVVNRLEDVVSELEDLNSSNASINSNVQQQADQAGTRAVGGVGTVDINVNTNQRDTVRVEGLENLGDTLRSAIRNAQEQQLNSATVQIDDAIQEIFLVLRERGLISSLGQGQ